MPFCFILVAYSSELLQLLPSDNREPISLSTVFGNSKYILERHTISLKQVDYGDGGMICKFNVSLSKLQKSRGFPAFDQRRKVAN